jgi:diacylglycerol kinase family enzyme
MLHFIYNPNAGNNNEARKANILKKLYAVPNSKVWETTKPLEATNFTKKAIEDNASRIIAVGGDGTVNEVASVLTETTIPLGIIPIGSGNGLARHLNIPIQFEAALDRAINGHEIAIDVGLLNNKMFFCTAGIGFDAKVAQLFAKSSKRGFFNYIKATLSALTMYHPIEISINHGPMQKRQKGQTCLRQNRCGQRRTNNGWWPFTWSRHNTISHPGAERCSWCTIQPGRHKECQ